MTSIVATNRIRLGLATLAGAFLLFVPAAATHTHHHLLGAPATASTTAPSGAFGWDK